MIRGDTGYSTREHTDSPEGLNEVWNHSDRGSEYRASAEVIRMQCFIVAAGVRCFPEMKTKHGKCENVTDLANNASFLEHEYRTSGPITVSYNTYLI